MKLFQIFELETSSFCHRTCKSCLRNSHPDRDAVESWFNQKFMPIETIHNLFGQLVEMDFRGDVCLQHYNEPLLDKRISEIARYAKSLNRFNSVFICTSADQVTEESAAELDGAFDHMFVALYMDEEKQKRRSAFLDSVFKKTKLIYTHGTHIPTHFSPLFDVNTLAKDHRDRPCTLPQQRLIINHMGDCLLCCDDMVNNFDLGNIRDYSLHELWFNEKHQQIIRDLEVAGGRKKHPYCANCPRP